MTLVADGSGPPLPSLSRQLSPGDVNMDLTMCGLLVERAEELARLYAEHGNWNDVKRDGSTNDYRTEAHGAAPRRSTVC